MTKPKLPLSDLDNALMEVLRPLASARVRLRVPFFANTFPIAFHYFQVIQDLFSNEDVGRMIQFVDWKERVKFESQSEFGPVLFYATREDLDSPERYSGRQRTECPVTIYKPLRVFAQFSLQAWEIHLTRRGETLKEIADSLFDGREVELFTDIPLQAMSVLERSLSEKNQKLVRVVKMQPADVFEHESMYADTVRLFLFGAPLTSYLSRKKKYYVPFDLTKREEDELLRLDSFRTFMVIDEGDDLVRLKDPISVAVETAVNTYHQLLFDGARDQAERWQFRTTQEFYNRTSRLLQLRPSFESAEDYAACLVDHHHPLEAI